MKSRSIFKNQWFWISLAIVAYLLAIAFDLTPYLRGPDEWQWENPDRSLDWRILPLLFLLLGIAVMAFWTESRRMRFRSRLTEVVFVGLLVALSLGLQLAVLTLESGGPLDPIFQRTISATSNGYYTAALDVEDAADAADLLRTYPSQMPNFASEHLRTHPPGLLVSHWLVNQGIQRFPALAHPLETWTRRYQCPTIVGEGRSAAELAGALVAGGLIMLLGALAVAPVYFMARQFGEQKLARQAAILYLLIPATAMFAPIADQIYPLLTISSLLALHIGLTRRRPAWVFLSGLLISIGSFLSLGLGAHILFLALYALLHPDCPPLRAVREYFPLAVCFIMGLVSAWLVYYLLSGVSALEVLWVARAQHYSLTVSNRSYLTWLGFNLYDFFTFLGWPLAFLVARSLVLQRRSAGWAVSVAFILTLFLLDLSGTTRAEVARLWLFLMPLAVLSAAKGLSQGRKLWQVVVALQAALVLVFAFSWSVIGFVSHPVTSLPRHFEPPTIVHSRSEIFDRQIEMLGYDFAPSTIQAGETLNLTLHWRVLTEPQESYKVFVHLLDSNGAIRAQADGIPMYWALPTTCWVRDEVISDAYALSIPSDALPGDYTLAVGFYQETTGIRLPVGESDHVQLGPVTILTGSP